MYLSEWTLTRNDLLNRNITDEYKLHQTMYDVYPNRNNRCFLYYAKYSYSSALKVLIQSDEEPSMPQYGNLQTKEVDEKIFHHRKYLFQTKFCPVKQKSHSNTVIPLKKEEDVFKWLTDREQTWGIQFNTDSLMKVGDGVISMRQKNNLNKITLNYVEITGILSVDNQDLFKSMILNGIGRSKGFGLGMVQIRAIE